MRMNFLNSEGWSNSHSMYSLTWARSKRRCLSNLKASKETPPKLQGSSKIMRKWSRKWATFLSNYTAKGQVLAKYSNSYLRTTTQRGRSWESIKQKTSARKVYKKIAINFPFKTLEQITSWIIRQQTKSTLNKSSLSSDRQASLNLNLRLKHPSSKSCSKKISINT